MKLNMKTAKEYQKLIDTDFQKNVVGKYGEAFVEATIEFSHKNGLMISHFDFLGGQVLFFTDHPLNDRGIAFVEVFGQESFLFVATKKTLERFITVVPK